MSILGQLKSWMDKTQTQGTPQSVLGKVVNYLVNSKSRLENYVEARHLPIDNEMEKPRLKPLGIGDNAWLLSDISKSAAASA